MIQIRIAPDERYSLSEMAQMAVEGGCGWIVLAMPGADPGEWRDVGAELVPLCRDAGVILTVEDDVAAVRELGAHGVYLHIGSNAAKIREDLGPEAIVGAEVGSADAAVALGKADIDYLTIAPSCGDPKALIAASRTGGAEDVIANSASYLADGFAGFYVTGAVFDAADPVAVVGQLQKLR